MLVVGLTGGIGSGKSTVARMFESLEVPVYYSDSRAKALMAWDGLLRPALVSAFGEEVYKNGELDRKVMAGKVFKDALALEKLNAIVHPAVRKDFHDWLEAQKTGYVIQEIPLLFENGLAEQYDLILTVTAPLEERIKRVMLRDEVERQAVLDRMANQLSEEEKVKGADFVIYNLALDKLKAEVVQIHQKILAAIP